MSKARPIVLVTGGSRGLGRSMARTLASRGSDVILTFRSDEAAAAAAVGEVEQEGGRAVALPLDLGDASSFAAFGEQVRSALDERWQRGQFDYLVNNGGHGVHATFLETTEAQFDDLMNVHLKGTFFLTQRLAPLIADGGRVVNISSGLTRFTFPGYAAYAAMKGGVEVLTRYLAKELAPRGIAVNTLAPGAIETDFGGGAVRDDAELNQMLTSLTALGRVGRPDDIGGAVANLLAPGSQWITGQRIEASGGMLL